MQLSHSAENRHDGRMDFRTPRWVDVGPTAIASVVTAEIVESRPDAPEKPRRSDRHVVVYLAFLSALMAVSIDTALPAFDEIRDHFDLIPADNRVSLIITSFFIGAALGHLFYGPFSDRFGRGPVLARRDDRVRDRRRGRHLRPVDDGVARVPVLWGLGRRPDPACSAWRSPSDLYEGNRMARVMSVVMAVFLIAPVDRADDR